jgi:disulfide oxidoreductase YuzD
MNVLGADAIISTVNVPAFNDQYLFLEAAIEAGVKRFLPSEFGSNVEIKDVASVAYLQPKIQLGHLIEKKAEEGLIEYTFVITGMEIMALSQLILLGNFPEYFLDTEFYGVNYQKRTWNTVGHGTKPNTWTSLPDVGKYVVAILFNPALTRNQNVLVESFQSNYVDIINFVGEKTGRKFTVHVETPEEQVSKGVPANLVEMRTMLLDGRGLINREGWELWNSKFPEVKPATFEQAFSQVIERLEK